MGRPQRNIFNFLPKCGSASYGANLAGGDGNERVGPGTKLMNKLSKKQIESLQVIYSSYTSLLAGKEYENLSNYNYAQYVEIAKLLKLVQINDPDLKLFISIAENSLLGTVNVGQLYTRYAYNEIKVALLTKRINEILADKNTQSTATNVEGQFSATQTFTLSPLYSYYIYVYGMPEFGVGFDPVKLAFIKSLPQFTVMGQPDNEPIVSDVTAAPAGTRFP